MALNGISLETILAAKAILDAVPVDEPEFLWVSESMAREYFARAGLTPSEIEQALREARIDPRD